MFRKNFKTKSGYTIIETMIAISLFLVVVVMGLGALLNANLLHKKSQSMLSIIDNLNFIMEEVSSNLRTGSNFHCITGADPLDNTDLKLSGSNCWGIAFEYQNGDGENVNDQWVYLIDNDGKIWKSTEGPYDDPSNFTQLNPNEIYIDPIKSSFSILGAESSAPPYGDLQQPFVTIKLVGRIIFKNIETPFSLQTSVSQRNIDI